jgi:hypothetical protein
MTAAFPTSGPPDELARALPELVGHRDVAMMLHVEPRFARRVVERLGVPTIVAGQRTWFVRRDLLLQALGVPT